MTTSAEDRRIAAMKAKATPVVSCVGARLSPLRLLAGCSWLDLYALVLVLAEAADPVKLRAVVEATEDSTEVTEMDLVLRKAHRKAQDLRALGLRIADMPADVARGERAYLRRRKVARRLETQAATTGKAAA